MKSRAERLNEQLEHLPPAPGCRGQPPGGLWEAHPHRESHPETEDLVALAHALQQAPQIQPTPDFARHLERRLLRHHAELRLQRGRRQRFSFSLPRIHPALGVVLGVCLLIGLLSTGMLALAAQVTNPASPLFALKRWEQQVQMSLTSNPADQATLEVQLAREQLQTLTSLAGPAHEEAYSQALADLDQQINGAASAIHRLPVGPSQAHLAGELDALKSEAIQSLRGLFPRLTLSERLETTGELARLGDQVPSLTSAAVALPAHPGEPMRIRLLGTHLSVDARLLVNGQLVAGAGTLQQGQLTFLVAWSDASPPQTVGIVNPDGTAVQTAHLMVTRVHPTGTNQDGNGNRPTVTPTPGRGKPAATPTPNGHKPPATPTPHR